MIEWPQEVRCTDAFDRDSATTVLVRDGRAVLRTPPGDAAKYNARQLSELIGKLTAARNELYRLDT